MRIVGGNLKGRKIFQPRDVKTRPLKDLVKESIFNLLNHSNKFNLDLNKYFEHATFQAFFPKYQRLLY